MTDLPPLRLKSPVDLVKASKVAFSPMLVAQRWLLHGVQGIQLYQLKNHKEPDLEEMQVIFTEAGGQVLRVLTIMSANIGVLCSLYSVDTDEAKMVIYQSVVHQQLKKSYYAKMYSYLGVPKFIQTLMLYDIPVPAATEEDLEFDSVCSNPIGRVIQRGVISWFVSATLGAGIVCYQVKTNKSLSQSESKKKLKSALLKHYVDLAGSIVTRCAGAFIGSFAGPEASYIAADVGEMAFGKLSPLLLEKLSPPKGNPETA